jgi:diguanylate cyclase (GGDEF)-like protein/PAS domain S-box-containing protein
MFRTTLIDSTRRRGHLTLCAAAALLVVGVTGSWWGWHATVQRMQADADAEFARYATLTFTNIEQRVEHQLDLLASFQSLFRAGNTVTRQDFHRLHDELRVSVRFPGVQAVQFSRWLPQSERAAFEANVRGDTSLSASGYPDYTIHPPGVRPHYLAVTYNEPMAGNEVAFGHDSALDPSLRELAERARDLGQPQSSAPIQLLQGRPGYVIRIPLYRAGKPLDSVTQRRQAYLGQISGVFQADALLREIVQVQADSNYRVVLQDMGLAIPASDAAPDHPTLLAKTGAASDDMAERSSNDVRQYSIEVGGRIWRIEVARASVNAARATLPLLLLCAGLALSLLVSAFVARLSLLYTRAAVLARRLNADAQGAVKRLDAVLDSTADGVLTLNDTGHIVTANRSAEAMFGFDRGQLTGQPIANLLATVPPQPRAAELLHAMGTHQAAQPNTMVGQRLELTALRADTSTFPIQLVVTEVLVDGQHHFVGSVHDLTEAKAAEEAIAMTMSELQDATDLREAMFRHAAFAIIMTDGQGLIQAMNPAAERLLDCHADDAVGFHHFARFMDNDEMRALSASMSSLLVRSAQPCPGYLSAARDAADSMELELSVRRESGSRVPVSLTVSPLRGEAGSLGGFLYIAYDVTERRQLAEQMSRLAYTDGLTGLPNRLQLERELERALTQSRERGTPLALLFIDLDRFKPINDTHGHAVGDLVLREVGSRLQAALRASDTAARIGGDEFVVLLSTLSQASESALVADKLIGALSAPMQLGGVELSVGASVGVVTYPDGGSDAEGLLRSADAAMYQAKQARRPLSLRGTASAR